jgi:hypothetical protein
MNDELICSACNMHIADGEHQTDEQGNATHAACPDPLNGFTHKQAMTVLAALRVLQRVRKAGIELPVVEGHTPDLSIEELEYFEEVDPLEDVEIEQLCDQIVEGDWRFNGELDWPEPPTEEELVQLEAGMIPPDSGEGRQ